MHPRRVGTSTQPTLIIGVYVLSLNGFILGRSHLGGINRNVLFDTVAKAASVHHVATTVLGERGLFVRSPHK